jgi:hypothetical protein
VKYGTISPEDLHLIQHANDPATALQLLQDGLTKYYLQPEEALPTADRGTPSLAKSRV